MPSLPAPNVPFITKNGYVNPVWYRALLDFRKDISQSLSVTFLNAGIANLTGDGTVGTITFDNLLVNRNSGYNLNTDKFTAPNPGQYLFMATVQVANIEVDNTFAILSLKATSSRTGLVTLTPLHSIADVFGTLYSGGSGISLVGHNILDLEANDTVELTLSIGGHASKNINIVGFDNDRYFTFLNIASI